MKRVKLNRHGIAVIVGSFSGPLIQAVLLFTLADRLNIPRAWIFIIASIAGLTAGTIWIYIVNPELLNIRGSWKRQMDSKKWDKLLWVPAFGVVGLYAPVAVTGLDIKNGWSNLGIGYAVFGAIIFAAGLFVIYWAMAVNTHFETTVRIQTDREHKVITDGPYKLMRHPGYAGGLLWLASGPLIVGSAYAFIPVAVTFILVFVRTWAEDNVLTKELKGYAEYTQKVKYRIFPGIW